MTTTLEKIMEAIDKWNVTERSISGEIPSVKFEEVWVYNDDGSLNEKRSEAMKNALNRDVCQR